MTVPGIGALVTVEKLARIWVPAGIPRENITAGFDGGCARHFETTRRILGTIPVFVTTSGGTDGNSSARKRQKKFNRPNFSLFWDA
ncbi:hypothetical protein IAD21_00830 [Abditibacteriota bacterium]|nr:hypothetical protein IAD21_00830 [Abditibacteriota bacterium]